MSSESNAGNAVITVSVSGGLIATLNEYAVVISLGLTILGLLIGLFFHIMALKDRRVKMERERMDNIRMKEMEFRLAQLIAQEEKRKNAA